MYTFASMETTFQTMCCCCSLGKKRRGKDEQNGDESQQYTGKGRRREEELCRVYAKDYKPTPRLQLRPTLRLASLEMWKEDRKLYTEPDAFCTTRFLLCALFMQGRPQYGYLYMAKKKSHHHPQSYLCLGQCRKNFARRVSFASAFDILTCKEKIEGTTLTGSVI